MVDSYPHKIPPTSFYGSKERIECSQIFITFGKAKFMISKKHLKETIEKLILLGKIERAEKESGRGETITEEALDRELEKWFK